VFRAFGMEPSATVPDWDTIRAFHTPESRARLDAVILRALSQGDPYEHDVELKLLDGSTRWIIARGEVETFADGEAAVLRGTIQDITERKFSEQRLAKSEARYRSLIAASSEIVWTTDADGGAVDENRGWQAFTGQTWKQLEGYGWLEMIHPEDLSRTMELWKSALSTGETFHMRHRLRRRDGVFRIMDVRGVPARDDSGTILEWVGMHVDVTEQAAAEDAVRESQSRYQKLYDSDLIGIGYPDAAGRILDGNDALLRIIGYTREELRSGMVRSDEMTPPEFREVDAEHLAESAEFGRCRPYRKEYIRKDGSRVPVMVGFARLDGTSREMIGFVLDLSAQKEVEDTLREREQRFSALAEILPQLIWVANPEGNRTYANQRYSEYTGLTEEQILQANWRDLLHPEDVARTEELWAHSTSTGDAYQNEYRVRRYDGSYRSFLARAVPVRNDNGVVERWLGSATDIHDQKLAEETLRRTEKLAAAGRLAASIAHEINNPLEAVTNSLYLALMDTELNPDTRTYLLMADRELARVAQVATLTLRFHRQSVAARSVDVAEIMESAYGLYGPRFESSRITVQREYEPGQMLFCREDELRQVFANLLGNAFDASRSGGMLRIRIRSSRKWTGEGGAGLRVTIADTGDGVPVQMRKTIFEPFVSTKESTGTGLGLWVSDGIVKKHKGYISLRSRTDEALHGTVFSLFFPFDGIKPRDGSDTA
jgi:PAS domain S-box-containing protein